MLAAEILIVCLPIWLRGWPRRFDNGFTQRNTTIMSCNSMHLACMLKEAGGIPRDGNDREAWKAGERFGFENPDADMKP